MFGEDGALFQNLNFVVANNDLKMHSLPNTYENLEIIVSASLEIATQFFAILSFSGNIDDITPIIDTSVH